MKNIGLSIILIVLVNFLFAQGSIKGKVMSKESAEELIGATVFIKGTTIGSVVDIDGNYFIKNVPAGKHVLKSSYVSFNSDSVEVTVVDKQVITHNFSLGNSTLALEAFTVEAKAIRSSENYMLQVKQKSATVMEGITSQEITKRGDNDVASAAKRVTGVTIEGGKYVYIRGLSDRYSKTTLNGAEIPGLDPNKNAVELDLFPTNMVENMTVVKSFSPDLPGSFTGGLLNIETKDFPEKFTLQFSAGLGYNTQSSLNNNFLTHGGGSSEVIGKDDGTRDIPLEAMEGVPSLFQDNPRLEQITKSFSKEMNGQESSSSINQRYSFSVGNQKTVFGNSLGFIIGASYSKEFNHIQEDAQSNRYSLTGKVNEVNTLVTQQELKDTKSQEEVLMGILGNLSYKIGSNNKLGFTFVRNQSGTSNTTFQEGIFPKEDNGLFFQTRSLSYQERALTTYQLKGEHYFPSAKKIKVDWLSSYSTSSQNTPDQRFFSNDYRINNDNDTIYGINASAYPVPARYYRFLDQSTFDAKLNIEIPILEKDGKTSKIKIGGAYLFQNRDYFEFRYNYRSQGASLFDGNVDGYLVDENMNLPTAGNPVSQYLYIENASEARNNYTGEQTIFATYLMGDIWATKKLRLIGGARLETTHISTINEDPKQTPGDLNKTDVLPALNLAYTLTPKSNLRGAYSKTIARPTFREISGFANFDFAANWIVIGNTSLDRTLIDNFDLRYELFPKVGELISFGVFYKNFTNPIEFVFNTQAQNDELTWRNVDNGTLYGAEIEVKKLLPFISTDKHQFSVGGNFSIIKSQVDIDDQQLELIRAQDPTAGGSREMFGQSPYIVNAFFGYNNDSLGLSINLNYNVAGEKITLVVIDATPNVKAQPVHALNANISKNLGKNFKARFSVNNILNPVIKQTQEFKGQEYIFNSYKQGTTYGISLSYLF